MAAGVNMCVCRMSIFLGMIAAAVTLLYFAPTIDQSYKNCDRPCHELDWPMICRFKFVIEKLPPSVICQDCHNCSFCSSLNDLPQEIKTVNRQLPGPPIHVCQNDIVIIDVINKLQSESLTMHWRGQSNMESPFMDGVPLITQCPIGGYTTFQYKFRASASGTHSYHAFSDSDRSSGLYGALIVRKPERTEENRVNYDIDNKNNILILSESRGNILVNGVGPSGAPLSTFPVRHDTTNLFRVLHASSLGCPMSLTVDNHILKVISVDGNPIKPIEVSSVKLTKGESIDFALSANQPPNTYFIRVGSHCSSKNIKGRAMLKYEGSPQKSNKNGLNLKKFKKMDTGFCESKTGKVCLQDIESTKEMNEKLEHVHKRIYLGFDKVKSKKVKDTSGFYRTNNVSFIFPPSPMLTQPSDVPVDIMCNESYLLDRCRENEKCNCVHLEHIPLGSSTEIVLVDQGGDDEEKIFHLHGYQFYLVGTKIMDKPMNKEEVRKLDYYFDFVKRNLKNPPLKTTVRLPKNGVVAIRFLANNPGFWMLRDENARGWTKGLDIIFQVGDTGDLVETPTDFPECGNFIGPEFFLV